MRLRKLAGQNAGLRLRLIMAASWSDPAEQLKPPTRRFVQPVTSRNQLSLRRDGGPEVGHAWRVASPDEIRWGHSDDGERGAVYLERCAGNLTIRVELAQPKRMAQNHDRICSWYLIFFRTKDPANDRVDSQHGEIACGNELAFYGLWFRRRAPLAHGFGRQRSKDLCRPTRSDYVGEGMMVIPVIEILRIGKGVLHVSCRSACKPSLKSHNIVWILHRQRFERQGVKRRKKRQ